jgi:hypothetical protein
MNLTLKQIQELSLKERRQLGANINYFLSNMYFVSRRRKRQMQAIQELENEDETTRCLTNA